MTTYNFASAVTAMSSAITDAVKANQKLVRVFTDHATLAKNAGQSTDQIVELLSCARRESLTQVDAYVKYCAARGEDSADIRRAFTNASAYAARVVGDKVLDVKIVWDRANDCYKIKEKPAAGEPSKGKGKGKPSASTKGQPKSDAAEQSKGIVDNATMPTTADHMRTISLEVALAALIEVHGLAAIQAEYLKQSQAMAAQDAAEKATADDLAPRAPAIEKKSTEKMAELAKKAPRKAQRGRKPAANVA